MKIAVEIDNIVRDNNLHALKYYLKGYDSNFCDEEIDMDCSDLLSNLPFKSQKERKTFKEIDYPYELFGCAKTTSKHLHVEVSDWLSSNEKDEIIYFSFNDSDLIIQSTYFFLSKGSRVRTVFFPKKAEEVWSLCDVAVTINDNILKTKPNDKKCIVIKKSDNVEQQQQADLVYDSFHSMLKDKKLKSKLKNKKVKKNNFIQQVKKWITKK